MRDRGCRQTLSWAGDFPSFSEGLSLRGRDRVFSGSSFGGFPFLFGGTFIEGRTSVTAPVICQISLPFRRDFH